MRVFYHHFPQQLKKKLFSIFTEKNSVEGYEFHNLFLIISKDLS